MTDPIDELHKIKEMMQSGLEVGNAPEKLQAKLLEISSSVDDILSQTFPGADEENNVDVEVNGKGDVIALKVSARAMQKLDHEILASKVVEAINAAYRNMGQGMSELFARRLGIAQPDVSGPPPKITLD